MQKRRSNRERILAGIVTAWGGAVVLRGLFGTPPSGSESYNFGYSMGTVFGGILLIVGLYYLLRK
jgi:hypothetical protein